MSPDDATRLRKSCQQARRANKPFRFFYCASAADNQPRLLIEKRMPMAEVKALRRTASKKRFISGTVAVEDGNLVFRTKKPQKQFIRDLKTVFGAEVPMLRKAQVVGLEADPSEGLNEGADGDGAALSEEERRAQQEAAAAQARLDALKVRAEGARQHEVAARGEVSHLIEGVLQSDDEWDVYGLDSERLAQRSAARLDALETHFSLLEAALQGRIDRAARKAEAHPDDARQAVSDAVVSQAKKAAYEMMLDELQASLLDLKDAAAERFLLEVALEEGVAAEAEAMAACEEARARSLQVAETMRNLEEQLVARAATRPAVAALFAESHALEQEAEARIDDAMDLQDELVELDEEREAVSQAISAAITAGEDVPPLLLSLLADLEQQSLQLEQQLDQAMNQTSQIQADAEHARMEADLKIQASEDEPMRDLLTQLEQCRASEASCAEDERSAENAVVAARVRLEEQEQRHEISALLAEATAWQARQQATLTLLASINPRSEDQLELNGAILSQPGVVGILADGEHYLQALLAVRASRHDLESVFGSIQPEWQPKEYAAQLAYAKSIERWCAGEEGALSERVRDIESYITLHNLVEEQADPDPDTPAYTPGEDDQAIARELRERFRLIRDPRTPDDTRAYAMRSVALIAEERPQEAIAWMASLGDSVAVKLHGQAVPAEQLRLAASAVVLRGILLRSSDGEGHLDQFDAWLSNLQTWSTTISQRLIEVLKAWRHAIKTDSETVDRIPEGIVDGVQHASNQLRNKHATIQARAEVGVDTGDMLAQIKTLRGEMDTNLRTARKILTSNINMLSAKQDTTSEERRHVLATLTQEHLRLYQSLSDIR